MAFRDKFPQTGIFIPFRIMCLGGDRPSVDLQDGARIFLQIQIPICVSSLSPIGFNNQVFTFMNEIGNRSHTRLSRFSPHSFQEKNCLCTKLAANPSLRKTKAKGIDPHEPFDENSFHVYLTSFFSPSSSIIFTPKDFAFSYFEPGSSPRTR